MICQEMKPLLFKIIIYLEWENIVFKKQENIIQET